METAEIKRLVEAALFSAPGPLSAAKLCALGDGLTNDDIRTAVDALNDNYRSDDHAFRIEEIAGGYRMLTRKEMGEALATFFARRSKDKLSRAALETLAIIAYKQPVTRASIENVRGVASDHIVSALTDIGLVKVSGQADAPGRPMLYATTKKFLDHFGLKALKDLPREKEFDSMGKA